MIQSEHEYHFKRYGHDYYIPSWKKGDSLDLSERRQAFEAAYMKLGDKDQIVIDVNTKSLVNIIKGRGHGTQFSNDMAIELLACLGMMLAKNE